MRQKVGRKEGRGNRGQEEGKEERLDLQER